jgi:hydroxymethylbilane synthase
MTAPLPEGYPLKLGTRGSPLALAQALTVQAALALAHGIAADAIEIVIIKTTGDQILDRSLEASGGKGLFTKELDIALIDGTIDFAVHSAKDLPTLLPPEIVISGYLPREDVRDVWISPVAGHPRDLPKGAKVGTASLRRGAMLKRLRPDLDISLLRGNVQTRLAKVESGEFSATLLALAGLKRLGLVERATTILDIDEFLPAAGQGAIAITSRTRDHRGVLKKLMPILHGPTGFALAVERAFLEKLDGSCRAPIGAHARLDGGDQLSFKGVLLRPDGSAAIEVEMTGPKDAPVSLGESAAADILARAPPGFRDL